MKEKFQEVYDALTGSFPLEAITVDNSRGFGLASIKNAYIIERLNKVFGIGGYGWRFALSPFATHQEEVVVHVAFQYRLPEDEVGSGPVYWDAVAESWTVKTDGRQCWSEPVFGVGGNRIGRGGVPRSDAEKSAVSNALGKAVSRIGVGIQAYKGELVVDGKQVTMKSGESLEEQLDDTQHLLYISLMHLAESFPEVYDNLVTTNEVAKGYHMSQMIHPFLVKMKEGEMGDFVKENIATLSGNRKAKKVTDLSITEFKALDSKLDTIIAGEKTWEEVLKESNGGDKGSSKK